MKKLKVTLNEDLAKERAKCNFDLEEITNLLDGGTEITSSRRKLENLVFNDELVKDAMRELHLSHKDKYEQCVRRTCQFVSLVLKESDFIMQLNGLETFASPLLRRTSDGYFQEVSPFLLHLGLFVPTLLGQCSPVQKAYWLPKALSFQIIGTYCQTELGHGSFVRGLETTATYDPDTEEFILHSPTVTSTKWWAGGLGKSVNHCVVMANLHTKGECHGVHPFIIQIRDLETHMPLPGIQVGEIGPKMGYNTADNGFLSFNQFRIPRDSLLMKNAQVLKDGTYVKTAKYKKFSYGTMIFARVMLVAEMAYSLSKAVTIAVRYSAVRRQNQIRANEPEVQILDYVTQQHKLFITIASAHAVHFVSNWLWQTYNDVQKDMQGGNNDKLPELHALSSCLKALSTADAISHIEQCRIACGGFGYLMSSNLPRLYTFAAATHTYEGEYTILLLQTARFLVKSWELAEAGKTLTPTVKYLNEHFNGLRAYWDSTSEGIIRSLQAVAAGRLSAAVQNIRKHKRGVGLEDAWELSTIRLAAASEAHCRAVICSKYYEEIVRLTKNSSPNVRKVMMQLNRLYLLYWSLKHTGDLLRYSTISEEDLLDLQEQYENILSSIRPNAVGLVDAFDLRDEILCSILGSYDGRVYERLMEEALKSPLNAEPVNQSFHKYIKPLMMGKL